MPICSYRKSYLCPTRFMITGRHANAVSEQHCWYTSIFGSVLDFIANLVLYCDAVIFPCLVSSTIIWRQTSSSTFIFSVLGKSIALEVSSSLPIFFRSDSSFLVTYRRWTIDAVVPLIFFKIICIFGPMGHGIFCCIMRKPTCFWAV